MKAILGTRHEELVLDEAKIIEGVRGRDEAAFSAAISRYSRLLWVVASRHLPKAGGFSEHDIEECVADVFFDLWQDSERYDPEKGSLKSYLCMLASRKAISRYRRAAQSRVISLEELRQGDEPSFEDALDAQDYGDLYAGIARLPEPTREILMRRYFYNEQPAAIAARMQLPKKEIENRLYRAKKSLSCSLSERYKEVLS
ncbi:MAG: sigma-70 family RNA polymerase sigma factor [Eggerthellaceae bacterium]|nr:sigma-70 family RNA polymerase sigma factor [Eggerthellaceae bacterium]